jgi:hypothetical protein
MGQSALSLTFEVRPLDEVDVAYEELAAGKNEEAVTKLLTNGTARSGDPAALINLGAAYARQGMTQQAVASFKAAVDSPERYDLELADGTWMDSRWAARKAMQGVLRTTAVAVR